MPEDAIEKITATIATVGRVPAEEKTRAVSEFIALSRRVKGTEFGGEDYRQEHARGGAGHRTRPARMLSRATGYSDIRSFENLKRIDPLTVANYLKNEHVQTMALVLAHMDPRYSGPILALLPAAMQGDIAYRIATLGRPNREALELVESVIAKQVQGEFSQTQRQFGGKKQVAEILNEIEKEIWQEILDEMREIDDAGGQRGQEPHVRLRGPDQPRRPRHPGDPEGDRQQGTDPVAQGGHAGDPEPDLQEHVQARGARHQGGHGVHGPGARCRTCRTPRARIVEVVRSLEEAGTIVLGKGGKGAEMVA